MRGSRIAAALVAEGFETVVVLGGERPPGIGFGGATVRELSPVKAGPDGFSALVTPDGRAFDDEMKAARRERLLELLAATAPDILLIEAFPFGRRAMRFELLPLLEAAAARRPAPLVAASIRDILQEHRGPRRDAETVETVLRFFDRVLVHGDPALVRLEQSFGPAAALADRVAYTGIVGAAPEADQPGETHAVIVSVGGGAVGRRLIETALAARPLTRLATADWLILTGPNGSLAAAPVTPGVSVRAFTADLPRRLRRARVSVSQAGYNTVADLLASPTCRAVLVPYAGSGETEQTRRAALMEAGGLAVVVAEAMLTPATLAAALDRALDGVPPRTPPRLDGASRTATILKADLRARSGRRASA